MLSKSIATLLLVIVCSSSYAQALPNPAECSAEASPVLPHMMSLSPALLKSGRSHVSTTFVLAYDAAGTVTDVRLGRSSGDRELDKVLRRWARRITLRSGTAGRCQYLVEIGVTSGA